MAVGNVLMTPTDVLFKCFHDDDVYSWFPLCPVINMLKEPPPLHRLRSLKFDLPVRYNKLRMRTASC